jgi:ribose transport system ATP-binding protein
MQQTGDPSSTEIMPTPQLDLLRLEHITKQFPGVKALDDVSFDLRPSEVHVLLGENGAGKSTLMKVLAGVYPADSGRIVLNGQPVQIHSPRQARAQGISIIYQEFNLVPDLSVAQNIFLGREPRTALGLVDRKAQASRAKTFLDFLNADIDVFARVHSLGVAQQQLVEVAKALSVESRILIMDEPTATLSEPEIARLFETIRHLKQSGVSIIYISHRLQEIRQIGDRVTVLRDGRAVGTRPIAETSLDALIQMMVGRTVSQRRIRTRNTAGPREVLRVESLRRGRTPKDISLVVREGEIVALAGLVGSGRTELARAIFGIDPVTSGTIALMGRTLPSPSPAACIRSGMGFLPENRKEDGLAQILPVKDNIVQASLRKLFPWGLLDHALERATARKYIQDLSMACPSVFRMTRYLSGGTQQKVVLAKWLCTESRFLIFDEPTRGIDVGAKEEIHRLMNTLAEHGVGILMISSELPEVLSLSDRVYVMREGAITQELVTERTSQAEIIGFAAGGK